MGVYSFCLSEGLKFFQSKPFGKNIYEMSLFVSIILDTRHVISEEQAKVPAPVELR